MNLVLRPGAAIQGATVYDGFGLNNESCRCQVVEVLYHQAPSQIECVVDLDAAVGREAPASEIANANLLRSLREA
jgi:hypothetical protein